MGNVLSFTNCQEVFIENSILYGCGRIGLVLDDSSATLSNSKIWDCEYGAIKISEDSSLHIDSSLIEKVPIVFCKERYDLELGDIIIENSIITSPFNDGYMYIDRYYLSKQMCYLSENYDGMQLSKTAYFPVDSTYYTLNNIDSYEKIIAGLALVDTGLYEVFLVVKNDDKESFLVDITINEESLEEISIDTIRSRMTTIVQQMATGADIDGIQLKGSVVNGMNASVVEFEVSLPDMELEEISAQYKYTMEIFDIRSVNLESLALPIIDKAKARKHWVDEFIEQSVLIDGHLVHEVHYDGVNINGDFDEIMGRFITMIYDQTEDR